LAAFAAGAGIPIGVARALRRSGCPGFDGAGRVHVLKLAGWLATKGKDFTPPGPTLEESRARLARARATAIERRTEVEAGELLPLRWCLAGWDEAVAVVEMTIGGLEKALGYQAALQLTPGGRQDEYERLVAEQARRLGVAVRHARTIFENRLKLGPSGRGDNELDKLHRAFEHAGAAVQTAFADLRSHAATGRITLPELTTIQEALARAIGEASSKLNPAGEKPAEPAQPSKRTSKRPK